MKILMTLANPMTHDPRVYNEAITLIKAGHDVTVLGWDRDGKTTPTETIDGIKIVRCFNSKIMEFLKKDIFRMPLWWIRGYKKALKLYGENKFDIIHSHDLSSLYIGVKLKKKLGLPLIYDAHEIYGYLIADDVPKAFTKFAFNTERRYTKYVNHIITVNEPLAKYFKRITGKPISIIMNCKEVQGLTYKPTDNKHFTLLYLGTLDKVRYLTGLPDILKDLPDIHCIIGGKGKPEVENELIEKCEKLPNVDFVGMVPMKDVLPMTKKADVILCIFDPSNKNNKFGLPNKLFESMVYGRPIICTKNTLSGDIAESINCGLAAEYNATDIKEAIVKLKNNPDLCIELGKNGMKAAHEKYNWSSQAKKLLKIYEDFK